MLSNRLPDLPRNRGRDRLSRLRNSNLSKKS